MWKRVIGYLLAGAVLDIGDEGTDQRQIAKICGVINLAPFLGTRTAGFLATFLSTTRVDLPAVMILAFISIGRLNSSVMFFAWLAPP